MGKEEKMSVNRDMNKEEKLKALDAALTQIEQDRSVLILH